VSDIKGTSSWPKSIAAVMIGVIGALIIWVVTPYNNYVIGNVGISDSYLPLLAMFLILVLILGYNPLMRALCPRLAFDAKHTALAASIMLMASLIPGTGTLGKLPYAVTRVNVLASTLPNEADTYQRTGLPDSLFPDPLVYGKRADNSFNYVEGLPKRASIPWRAWLGPLLGWGALLFAGWMMLIGMSLIVLPQWRQNERLPFPLLGLQQSLIENPEPGMCFAPVFRTKGFWISAGAVFVVHLLEELNRYFPNNVPAIPLGWSLRKLFASEPWSVIPANEDLKEICENRFYFLLFGFTYFIPNRVSFSIWFMYIAYALWWMVSAAYMPPFYRETITDHRTGALLLLAATILWLGRARWRAVATAMFRKQESDEGFLARRAGWLFLAGLCGMFAWLLWVGMEIPWALYFVALIFIVALVVNRVLAETGLPFVHLQTQWADLMYVKVAGLGLITPTAMFFNFILGMLFVSNSTMSAGGMSSHALALDGATAPRRQWRLAIGFLAVLAVGLAICGAVHLMANYHPQPDWGMSNWQSTKNGLISSAASWDPGKFYSASKELAAGRPGQLDVPIYNQFTHLGFGFGLAGVLQWLCLRTPAWPLHPIGLLLAVTPFVQVAWTSIFAGWLSKIGIIWIGGAALYRSARPVFIGFIMGELFAAIVWFIVPLLLALSGVTPLKSQVLP
jgi:hypothetical protein